MTRRLVAAGVLIVFLLIIFFGLRSCASSRNQRALKDYNRDVTQIATESVDDVMKPFFESMNGGGQDLQSRINQLRLAAEEQRRTAGSIDVPGDAQRAQNALELALNLRTSALTRIAQLVPNALSDNAQVAETAVRGIAGQMQNFLASDVVYSQRVVPYIRDALADADIKDQKIVTSKSLLDLGWLSTNQVADVLGAKRAQGGTGANPNPAPGTHGHGLTSVSVGTTTLNPDGTNRIPAGDNPTFNVKFQNQGENDESDVLVKITVKPNTGKTLTAQKKVNKTSAGTDATASLALDQAPPVGTPATITVEVVAVPGEKVKDNNKQSYTAIFTS